MTFATIYTRWINSAGLGLQPQIKSLLDPPPTKWTTSSRSSELSGVWDQCAR